MNLLEFYPTPPKLISKMLSGLDFKQIRAVLEPSAGKGGLCHAYDDIVRDSKYYIVESGQLLLGAGT